MDLVPARKEDATTCYQCIEDAKAYQRSLGFAQWGPDYPTLQIVVDDIAAGTGYAFVEGNDILGYCCLITDGEPAYRDIEGAWKTDRPYVVVHRMAFGSAAQGHGLSKAALDLIKAFAGERGFRAVRVDTQEENKVMRHILEREGFRHCGTITFDGGPKLAYEWDA